MFDLEEVTSGGKISHITVTADSAIGGGKSINDFEYKIELPLPGKCVTAYISYSKGFSASLELEIEADGKKVTEEYVFSAKTFRIYTRKYFQKMAALTEEKGDADDIVRLMAGFVNSALREGERIR